MDSLNSDIKSRILMEMQDTLTTEQLKQLKEILERNLYGVVITKPTTELSVNRVHRYDNEQMIRMFQMESKICGHSPKTTMQYVRETERFFLMMNKHYSEVVSDDIKMYLINISKDDRLSLTSVDNSRKFIKAFFKWLYENDYIEKDLFVKIAPIKREEKKKEYLTNSEIVLLRDSVKDNEEKRALIDFLLSTGLRVSELTNLKMSDVNFTSGEVTVHATKTNTWRTVYLTADALKHLVDYIKLRGDDISEYVFMNKKKGKISNQRVEKILHEIGSTAGVTKRCTVHLFRKTLATQLYHKGVDIAMIARILGHASIKTTEKYYLTLCDTDVKYAYYKCA